MAYIPLSRLSQVPEKIKDYPEFTMFYELPSWAFYVRHVKNISFSNVILKLEDSDFRPAFVFDDVSSIKLDNLKLPENNQNLMLFKSKNICKDEHSFGQLLIQE